MVGLQSSAWESLVWNPDCNLKFTISTQAEETAQNTPSSVGGQRRRVWVSSQYPALPPGLLELGLQPQAWTSCGRKKIVQRVRDGEKEAAEGRAPHLEAGPGTERGQITPTHTKTVTFFESSSTKAMAPTAPRNSQWTFSLERRKPGKGAGGSTAPSPMWLHSKKVLGNQFSKKKKKKKKIENIQGHVSEEELSYIS